MISGDFYVVSIGNRYCRFKDHEILNIVSQQLAHAAQFSLREARAAVTALKKHKLNKPIQFWKVSIHLMG